MNGSEPPAPSDNRLWEVFAQARERTDPAARAAYLKEACGADLALRQEVESLLRAETEAPDFLQQDALGAALDPLTEQPGTMIGNYQILQVLGEGGFGTVYRAEQREPVHREVALKIIKAGMDTKEVIARFEAERQALALMNHPNIARVYEAGATPGGRPYFVMELAQGMPITTYCDARRLSLVQRLKLFGQLCGAVQHAHQKGVIHRDLKPSNIVVTELDGQPQPKIIDFGIAKSLHVPLTLRTLVTRRDAWVGTPAYMSPEQMDPAADDVDTRSDIYSLGVLLYELLTGSQPFTTDTLHQAALEEVRRLIQETEPPKPSTRLQTMGEKATEAAQRRSVELPALRRLLQGDLDWIVMKALEKDRTRRYDTANGLAQDIEHHLHHEPVSAGPPSAWYRFQKFTRRRRRVLAVVGSIVVVLLGASIFSLWQAAKARQNAAVARQMQTQAQQAQTQAAASAAELKRTLVRTDFTTANDLFEANQGNRALAHLARALRNDPSYWPAAMRLVSALTYRGFSLDPIPTLTHPEDYIVKAELSDPSGFIVTLGRDGRLRTWEDTNGAFVAELELAEPLADFLVVPRAQQIVSVGQSNSMRLLSIPHGETVVEIVPAAKPIRQVGLIPQEGSNSVRLVWLTAEGLLQCVPLPHGQPPGSTRTLAEGVARWHSSPNGRIIAAEKEPEDLVFLDVDAARVLAAAKAILGRPVAFSGRGELAAFMQENPVDVAWIDLTKPDLPPQRPILETSPEERAARAEDLTLAHLRFSADEVLLLVLCKNEKTRRLKGATINLTNRQIVAAFQCDSVTKDAANPEVGLAYGLYAVVDNGHQVRVCNVETGRSILYPPQPDWITQIVFSPDGSRLAAAEEGGRVQLWRFHQGQTLELSFKAQATIIGMAFSPDGERLITAGGDRQVQVWNARTCQAIAEPQSVGGYASVQCFSPDGTRALLRNSMKTEVGGEWARFRWWNCVGRRARDLEGWAAQPVQRVRLSSQRHGPEAVRIEDLPAPQGSVVWEYDLLTGQTNAQVQINHDLNQGFFFGETMELLVGLEASNRLHVYRWRAGKELATFEHPTPVQSFLLSAGGDTLLTADDENRFRLWNVQERRLVATIDTYLGGAKPVWNYEEPTPRLQSAFISITLSGDGRWLAITDIPNPDHHLVRVWNAQTGARAWPDLDYGLGITSVGFSPDSRLLHVGHTKNLAQIYEVATGRLIQEMPTDGWIRSFDISSDGRRLVTMNQVGNVDRMILRVWDITTGRLLCQPSAYTHCLKWIRFLAQGELVVGGCSAPDQTVKIWETETGQPVVEPRHCELPYLLLDAKGRTIADALWEGGYHGVRWRGLPERAVPVPQWLPALAEAVAGQRLDALGVVQALESSHLARVKQHIAGASPEQSYVQWARWFLEEPSNRSLNPFCEQKPSEAVDMLLQRGNPSLRQLQRALLLCPTNGEVMRRLALGWNPTPSAVAGKAASTKHWLSPVDWYSRQATNLAPDSISAWEFHAQTLEARGEHDAAQRVLKCATQQSLAAAPSSADPRTVKSTEWAEVHLQIEHAKNHIRTGDFQAAGSAFAEAVVNPAYDFLSLEELDPFLSLKIAPALLLAEQTNAYEAFCRQLLSIPSEYRRYPERHLRMLLLGAHSDPAQVRQSVDRTRQYDQKLPFLDVEEETNRGLAEYRAGEWKAAYVYSVRGCQSEARRLDEVTPMAFAAMAAFRLGDRSRALRWLSVAEYLHDQASQTGRRTEWFTVANLVALRQARRFIGDIPAPRQAAFDQIIQLLEKAEAVGRRLQRASAAKLYAQALELEDFDLLTFEGMDTCLAVKMATCFCFGGQGDKEHLLKLWEALDPIPIEQLRDRQLERHAQAILISQTTAGPHRHQAAAQWLRAARFQERWKQDPWWQSTEAIAACRQERFDDCFQSAAAAQEGPDPICQALGWVTTALAAVKTADTNRAAAALKNSDAIMEVQWKAARGDCGECWHQYLLVALIRTQAKALLKEIQKPKDGETQ